MVICPRWTYHVGTGLWCHSRANYLTSLWHAVLDIDSTHRFLGSDTEIRHKNRVAGRSQVNIEIFYNCESH